MKAYIYPNSARLKTGVYNPYLDNFTRFNGEIHFLNAEKPSNTGIFDLVRYFRRADIIFLNWFENVPEKKFGIAQALFFFLLIPYFKISGKKIIWTLHNKLSHSRKHRFLKKRIFRGLMLYSDLIITHCTEGENFVKKYLPGKKKEVLVFPHPVAEINKDFIKPGNKKFDILIWGTLAPYKGVDKFLRLLKIKNLSDKFTIVIAGKVVDENYRTVLQAEITDKVIHHDRFLEEDELKHLVSESRITLFPYANDSVLSSGALMDSLSWGGNIIGPDKGAFADLRKEGLINTFRNYDELLQLLDDLPENTDHAGIITYLEKITWKAFSSALLAKIKTIKDIK